MNKHTPGPWHVDDRFVDGDNDVLDPGGWHVAEVERYQGRKSRNGRFTRREISTEEQMANARLVAAAPDMLEALRFALGNESGFACPAATEKRMRAAIAKAEGRA